MTEPVLAIPVVLPAAAVALYEHLEAQGRAKGTVQQLTQTLARALERTWGTSAARRFSDNAGGGWFVDLSEYCEGEMLYGVVRSGPGGSRTLDSVVDTDAVEAVQRGDAQAVAVTLPDGSTHLDNARPGQVAETIAAKPNPLDPMLVVINVSTPKEGHVPYEKIQRCTRAEAPALITKLLRQGFEGSPLTEDQIEIWSVFSKPRVEITF